MRHSNTGLASIGVRILTFLFGKPEEFLLEHRVFNAMLLVSTVIAIAGSTINGFLDVGIAFYIGFSCGVIFLVLYYVSRVRHASTAVLLPYVLFMLILIPFNWFQNAGMNGPNINMFLLIVVFISIVIKNKWKFLIFFIFLLTESVLFFIERRSPDLVAGYASEEARFFDIFSTLVYIAFIIFSLVHIVMRVYERAKLESENKSREIAQTLETLQQTQDQLIKSEKLAAVGHLIAGIAHEVNTPLGAIKTSNANIGDYLEKMLNQFPKVFRVLNAEEQALFLEFIETATKKGPSFTSKEERTMKKLIAAEMKERDIEGADYIADMLVDMGIYAFPARFQPLFKSPDRKLIMDVAYHYSGIKRNSRNIALATEKASKVVFALKNYSRRADMSGEKSDINIIETLETVLTLYHNQLKHSVEVARDFVAVPLLRGYPDELVQVWTNIVQNSLQAMDYKGKLEIKVRNEAGMVVVSIGDNGQGIPGNLREKIFEPFFTTKPQGEGTGLGLDIVTKIIDKHGGSIRVESEVGKGSTFFVSLPLG